MSFENLLVDKVGTLGAVAQVTINREKALNALDGRTIDELLAAFAQLRDDESVRAILLTGAGPKAFVAGADIKAMADLDGAGAAAFSAKGHALGDLIRDIPKVVIAAVNGFALGGGCELMLCCDFAYASENAKFGQPEVNLGVIPGFGGTTRLPRRIGAARAIELATSGATIDAQEALRIGLVNRVVPAGELAAQAIATAEAIAKKGPVAVAAVKRSIRASQEVPLAENNRLEIALFGACFETGDQKEGMRAFIEKRPAAFTGK